MWAFLSRNRDAGILVLRLGIGGFFLWAYGWPKLAGGVEKWKNLGEAIKRSVLRSFTTVKAAVPGRLRSASRGSLLELEAYCPVICDDSYAGAV